jgi:hypothetical protein
VYDVFMPTISIFFGIVIQMFWNDHSPPHFHCKYGEHNASIDINQLMLMSGSLPRRTLNLVLDWAELHQQALLDNWKLCQNGISPKPIPPLE